MLNIVRERPQVDGDDDALKAAAAKLLHKTPRLRLASAAALAERRFFAGVDFATLPEKRAAPPFRPRPTSFAAREDPALAAAFGPARAAGDGDGADRPSFSFAGGDTFDGFSVFASPARPRANRKRPPTPQVLPPSRGPG